MLVVVSLAPPSLAQQAKPNIILLVSDDTGYGDLGPYGGGEGRGMPTPNIDRLANEGMQFYSFYAQPSCTPGRAAHADRPHPEPQRHDDRGLPGPGRRPARGGVDAGLGAEDGRLSDLLHRQMASRRGRLRAAHRAGLRRDAVCRPLSPQRLHLRRPDLVPRHGPGAPGDVRAGDEGLAVGQGGRAGERGLQDQRPVRRHARRRASSGSRSSMATSRRRRSTISTGRPARPSRSS